ncbi:MAG: hypothetical protein ACOYBY_00225 [Dermatophilaceae bacterium]
MARPVEGVTRSDIDVTRYDDLSFDGRYGRVGVTLYLPSVRSVQMHGSPDVVVPYSAGWGEGVQAAQMACEGLARTINVMSVAIVYPRRRLGVSDILPFRTEVFSEVINHIKEETVYDESRVVVAGYSRGTGPGRLATLECSAYVTGLALVAPTWFPVAVTPHGLAARGLAESARGITRGSWFDRLGLIAASARLAQEMLAHPLALRNDVTAISQEGAADLESVLDEGINLSVTAGIYDELCPVTGIRQVVESLPERCYVDYREVPSDHFSYFLSPKPLRIVADQVAQLTRSAADPKAS